MSQNQMNENAQVIFSYIHCDKSDFAHEVNFDEENFRKEIEPIFETRVPVERVTLEFIMDGKQESGRFIALIRIQSPKISFEHTEEAYDNYAGAVNKAIHKAVAYLRNEKEKMTEH